MSGKTGNADGGSIGNFGGVVVNGYKSSEYHLRLVL